MINNDNWKEEYLNEEGLFENGSPEKESIFFDQLAIDIRKIVNHYKIDNENISRRANHAQILIGITDAYFKILPTSVFPQDLSFGFLQPGKEYKCILRFSNASGELTQDDSKPDLRGLAIRIETASGNHDFLMTNAELHHAKDAREAMLAIKAGVEKDIIADLIPDRFPLEDQIAGFIGALPFLIKHLGLKTAWHIANTLKKQMNLKVESLSSETFWSRAPIAIGNMNKPENTIAVKYRLRPTKVKPAIEQLKLGEKDLATKFANELRVSDIKYIFEVQFFINNETTPIENATVSWGDDTSFIPVAELVIPQNSENKKNEVDSISFNPWNLDLTNFKPLGSMNRARKKVYEASLQERNKT
ncbi:MAG: catalase [Saprospiraceae bacterium]|nr:catalase [Saprospiraceae bacterium]